MRIALVTVTKTTDLYPIGLLKISNMLKAEGNETKLFIGILPKTGEYEEIWISTVFTFDLPKAVAMAKEAVKRASKVRVGGVAATLLPHVFEHIGIEVYKGIMPEAENFTPDYTILDDIPKYSITHTSRGCVRKCEFCMVPIIEPRFYRREGWENDIHKKSEKILFYDNNFLAYNSLRVQEEVEKIKYVLSNTDNKSVDFNQALDCRLLTKEKADAISDIPIKPMRFAFDGMQEDEYYQKAITMLAEKGVRSFVSYVLYNFDDTPEDFYYRLKEGARLSDELGVSVSSFPMRYQPILEYDTSREYTGKNWTVKQKKGFMNILNKQSIGGQVSLGLKEFEYWFSDSPEKFKKLISWDKVSEYSARKKGMLRTMKALDTEIVTQRFQNG